MLLVLLSLFSGLTLGSGFRGPHHPNSHVTHNHVKPEKDASFTYNSELIHDIEHLKEDLGPLADKVDIAEMTPDHMDFFYFQVHDVDNNSKLDGLEMLHALQHIYEEEDDHNHEKNDDPEELEQRLNFITDLIDSTLNQHDLNNDGYLGYSEFKLSRNQGIL